MLLKGEDKQKWTKGNKHQRNTEVTSYLSSDQTNPFCLPKFP